MITTTIISVLIMLLALIVLLVSLALPTFVILSMIAILPLMLILALTFGSTKININGKKFEIKSLKDRIKAFRKRN